MKKVKTETVLQTKTLPNTKSVVSDEVSSTKTEFFRINIIALIISSLRAGHKKSRGKPTKHIVKSRKKLGSTFIIG